jgi:hypothetical protein
MEKLLLGLFVLVMSQLAVGQPATLQDNVFTIPQGAVIDNDSPSFFTDIQLSHEGSGYFKLADAKTNNLVTIDTVQIAILESFPVQVNVNVTGNKSVPCVELLTPAISRKDNLFVVVLAETLLGPEASCIAMIDPFEISFPLDISGLPAGTYTVRVNGVAEATFTLDTDIPPR